MSAPTPPTPPQTPTSEARPRVFRLPVLTYVVVLFVLVGAIPLAFTADGSYAAPGRIGLQTVIILIPVLALLFVARTATIVDTQGITVRAVFGSRRMPWPAVRGLSVTGRSVYVVSADGAVRLPCVRVADLAAIARTSAGRLPELADPTPKFAPQRRRRR